MIHRDCKTPQRPDDELKQYSLKVQDQTLSNKSFHVIDIKEVRKRKTKELDAVAAVATVPKVTTRPSKRTTKTSVTTVDEDEVVVVKLKAPKVKVMQYTYNIICT